MSGYFDYRILPDLRLLINYFEGDLNVDTIKNAFDKACTDKDFNPEYNTITDFRDTKVSLNEQELQAIVEHGRSKNYYAARTSVFVTNTPNHVVLSILYNTKSKEYRNLKVVSTIKAAMKEAGIPLCEYEMIENLINEMKSK